MAEIVQMDSNTWRIEDGFVRFFLLAGTTKAVMIDSGVNCPEAKKLAESLTDLPIMLLNTHGDGDHVSATGSFNEIYIGKEDYYNCGIDARFPDTKLCEVNDGEVFDLGGRHIRIISIPGHTAGSVAVLDVEKRVLYAGDSVQKGFVFMFGDKRTPGEYGKSLEKLVAMEADYDSIIASHDEPILQSDYASKVLCSWNKVMSGDVPGEEQEMFGTRIKVYKTENCGFYCDL